MEILLYGRKYSRMDQVKFVEDRQPLKNLKWYGLPKWNDTLWNLSFRVFIEILI